MDTYQARSTFLDMASEALSIVERISSGSSPMFEEKNRLRQMMVQAREALADAGYPAEGVWRGIQRAGIGVDTAFVDTDPAYWPDVAEQLREGRDTLEMLVSPAGRRETDFHIVG